MKYLAAYCLLNLAGKDKVTEKDLTQLLKDANAKADQDSVKSAIKQLSEKALHEFAREGAGKLCSGGAVAAGGAPAAGNAGAQ